LQKIAAKQRRKEAAKNLMLFPTSKSKEARKFKAAGDLQLNMLLSSEYALAYHYSANVKPTILSELTFSS